ncbi:MAG: hypothetical protein AAFP90_10340, partial [Planctomycetota bacterium]
MLVTLGFQPTTAAQPPTIPLGPSGPALTPIETAATAFIVPGSPFHVAVIEVPSTLGTTLAPNQPITIIGPQDRLFYPASRDLQVTVNSAGNEDGRLLGNGRLLRRIASMVKGGEESQQQTVGRVAAFLFTGDTPMQIRLDGPIVRTVMIDPSTAPAAPPGAHREALNLWWETFVDQARRTIAAAKYPAFPEWYLLGSLSRRFQLPLPSDLNPASQPGAANDPLAATDPWAGGDNQALSTLELLAGTERLTTDVFRELVMSGDTRNALNLNAGAPTVPPAASLPLPAGPNWLPPQIPPPGPNVPVEDLATRVPPECFYIRYGSFQNYLWFQDLTNEYGGDLTRMVTLRAVADAGFARSEQQLNLKTTELSRALGGSVIEDQAIIGTDLFVADGASMGVLFKSKNAFLLRNSLNGDRSATARRDPDVSLRTVKIAGQEVSFLHSEDHRVRSFMLESGPYFFVTNSRYLAERFIQVGQTGESLAATSEFQLARTLMPLDRQDTIFAYLSSGMLRGLAEPQYQIELRRRTAANCKITMARLAAAAYRNEHPDDRGPMTAAKLIRDGFLPPDFDSNPDGSGVLLIGDTCIDSMRGARGTFLPITDTPIESITPQESAWYSGVANYHSTHWQQMDPIMVGLRRDVIDPNAGVERIELHAEVAPMTPEKYGWAARQLGPPTNMAITFAPDDIVAVQAHVITDLLGGTIPPHHLFAALKDSQPPQPEAFGGLLESYFALQSIPGYLGAWPRPGVLDRLPLGLGLGTPVAPGVSRLLGGLYKYQAGGFSVLSFMPDVLNASVPYLSTVAVDDEAQIRGRVGNLY